MKLQCSGSSWPAQRPNRCTSRSTWRRASRITSRRSTRCTTQNDKARASGRHRGTDDSVLRLAAGGWCSWAVFVSIKRAKRPDRAEGRSTISSKWGERVFERLWGPEQLRSSSRRPRCWRPTFGAARVTREQWTALRSCRYWRITPRAWAAAAMVVVSLDGRVVVDSLHPAGESRNFEYSDLLTRRAQDAGHARRHRSHRRAACTSWWWSRCSHPKPIAYVAIGFRGRRLRSQGTGRTDRAGGFVF